MKRVLNNLARRKKLIRSVALVVLSRITEVENGKLANMIRNN